MSIDYGSAVSSGRTLSSMGYEVDRLIASVNALKEIVPSNYTGEDAQVYYAAVDQLQRELKSISGDLDNLGNRVINVANQLKG